MLNLQALLPYFLVLLLSLSVHEAAHAWTADRLGDPTARKLGRISLNPLVHVDWIGTVLFPLIALLSGLPLLGWAKPVPVDVRYLKSPRRDFAVIALAGPISNLLIAVIVAGISFAFGAAPGISSGFAWFLVVRTVLLNCSLAVFNLIPVPPLDGGNVAMGLLPISVARAMSQLAPYGFLILYALMFGGVLDRYVFPIAYTITDWLL